MYDYHYKLMPVLLRWIELTEIEGERTAMESSINGLPLAHLKNRCAQEMGTYYREKVSDERYCLEIFRRAIIEEDNEAWIALREQFGKNVVYWFRRNSKRKEALQIETEQNYVDDTFKRLWQWANNQKIDMGRIEGFHKQVGFNSLPGALSFLQSSLESLIIDNLRASRRQQRNPMPENDLPDPSSPEEEIARKEIWQAIRSILSDKREYRIIYLLYHEGLKPRHILQRCPDEFATIEEIRRLTKNAMDRLRRNKDKLGWKIDLDEP